MNIEQEYKATMVGLDKYLTEKSDIKVTTLFKHQQNNGLCSVPKEAIW